MRVIILAAGAGTRLGAAIPKVLLDLGGRTILERHIDSLSKLGLYPGNVTVVTGFMGGVLAGRCSSMGIKTVYNPCWRFPGTFSSFFTVNESGEDLLVLHGDLIWDKGMVSAALDAPGGIVVPADPARRLDGEAMKVEFRGSRLLHMSKKLPLGRSAGESMGIFLIREHGRLRAMSSGLAGKPHASLDDAVNIACGRMTVTAVATVGFPWEEIDTGEDMSRAVELFG